MRPAVLATFLLATLVTWPTLIQPTSAVLGHPGNDVWNHIWGYWWVAGELAEGRLPLSTGLMHFPDTSRLFFIDTFGAVITLPIQWALGPVAAINAIMFVCFWAAGFSAWLLGRHVLTTLQGAGPRTDRLAFLVAIAYAGSPHLIAQAYNGITETLFAAGLPFTTLASLRLYERPGPARAIVAGVTGALTVIANFYFGLFAVIGAVVLLGTHAWARRDRVHWRALPVPAVFGVALGLVLVAPVLMVFASTLDAADAIVHRDEDFVLQSLMNHNMTDVVSLWHPGKFYSPDLKAMTGEDLLIVTYVGWCLTLLAALGVHSLRPADRLHWMIWVAVFGVLCLGPYLYVNGGYVTVDDRKIPLPFLPLFKAIPVFQRISHPFRFVMGVQLGLGILAVGGLARRPGWVHGVAGALMIGESLLASPAPWPIARSRTDIPAYVYAMHDDPTPGAVVDLPINVPNLERAVYLHYQTMTGRPIPYSLNEPLPPILQRSHLARALLVAEGGQVDSLPPSLGSLDLVVAGRALARVGVRYIVVHERMYPSERLSQVLGILRTALGPETVDTGAGERVWRLDDPDAGGAS
ncbi:MAG: hypothetical protein EXR69_00740 [Myxococcales bacterium]|nr:hypothetical protein [Myxococcales bacterium]